MRLKKSYRPIRFKRDKFGIEQRETYYRNIFDKSTVFPKPLEYSDIDSSFFDFVKNEINLSYDGKSVPTFKFYSNQRFSEYSQTWKHTDRDGNLLMNFKTINRETNPLNGTNQGGYYNIPGNNKYTLLIRDAIDDNGTENYEVYSMKQPFAMDFMYSINFVTNSLEMINEFNIKINDLFKSIQCYIFPNGHSIPMTLENIDDNTSYVIDDRKFYVQTCTIKVMAYIIKKDDFKIDILPKKLKIGLEEEKCSNEVNIEENGKECLNIDFNEKNIVSFEIDTDIDVYDIVKENISDVRIFINDNEYNIKSDLFLHKNDNITIKIKKFNKNLKSFIKIIGK